jgi:hypothetical protein
MFEVALPAPLPDGSYVVAMEQDWMKQSPESPNYSGIDKSVPSPARMYDFWLGGKNNFEADRAAGQAVIDAFPGILPGVRANRAFLGRAVGYLAGEAGITQFLDIGTGLPVENNTHEVAQATRPESRVAYIDNDPIVLAHARALLTSAPEGATSYSEADVRDPDTILGLAAETLDFTEPVAITLLMILQLVPDSEDPYGIVARLMDATAPGSYLVISHPANDVDKGEIVEAYDRLNQQLPEQATLRNHAQVAQFFEELEPVDPGVIQIHRWRPDRHQNDLDLDIPAWAGVGRKS